ncbi:exosortase-associated protein EpsI, B-type [Undibacterium sp. Ren11W]|uniref:exosortase-associated protein EpsI, B-type n=1 Tax=Undibacterium sp. Ren11W TaxID=3413045 RepID=UPI003BEF6E4E
MTVFVKNIILMVAMLLAAGLTVMLRPTASLADDRGRTDLEMMMPKVIGEWQEQPNLSSVVINPEQKHMLETLYSDTLSRTYVNSEGYKIMLSIAYGKNQRDGMEMHKPDICYPAQGFEILNKDVVSFELGGGKKMIRANQMVTRNRDRMEPLMYWTLVGTQMFNSRLEKKYYEFTYAMRNKVADGMLVRVSSIDADTTHAFDMQSRFVKQMYNVTSGNTNVRLFGESKD